jgi:DNA modification methylase
MPTQSALKFINRYSIDTLRRIKEFDQLRSDASVKVVHGDSRYLETEMLDGIITSPPYVGLIDYHDQHAYAYHLLGLNNNSDKEIGPASKGTSIKAKQQYVEDIATVFRKAMSNMKQGGYIIVVAADRSDLYNDIAQQAGVQIDAILSRHVNRRTGRRSSEFFESIFIWRKP